MSTFVDSSAWFAAINLKDKHHLRSAALVTGGTDLVTTDFVLVETWLLLNARIGFDVARSFWTGMRRGIASIERVTPADIDGAWNIGSVFADQQFSLVDCTSFVVMERLGVTRVISFDNDFVIYRYGPNRDRAFEVLR